MTMPVFTIKAKDRLAIAAVGAYRDLCVDEGLDNQAEEVGKAIDEMVAWRYEHEDLVQSPDHEHVPAAPTSPSEPVPSTPRVWAMPEIPADVRRVFDRKGFVWVRDADEPIGRLWERADGRRFAAESQLIIDRGPLAEYVEDLRAEVEETNDGRQ